MTRSDDLWEKILNSVFYTFNLHYLMQDHAWSNRYCKEKYIIVAFILVLDAGEFNHALYASNKESQLINKRYVTGEKQWCTIRKWQTRKISLTTVHISSQRWTNSAQCTKFTADMVPAFHLLNRKTTNCWSIPLGHQWHMACPAMNSILQTSASTWEPTNSSSSSHCLGYLLRQLRNLETANRESRGLCSIWLIFPELFATCWKSFGKQSASPLDAQSKKVKSTVDSRHVVLFSTRVISETKAWASAVRKHFWHVMEMWLTYLSLWNVHSRARSVRSFRCLREEKTSRKKQGCRET